MLYGRLFLSILLCMTVATGNVRETRGTLGRAVPNEILDPPWLDKRAGAQLATLPAFGVFVDFRYQDMLLESGVTFRNRVVEDAGITYKAVHYDHGNGIAVADVDLDGRYDIYFVNQAGANELWRNLGGGRFENITAPAGVVLDDRISVTASFADIDNDGDPDLYVTAVRTGNVLFENLGDGRFRDVTAESGLGYQGHSSGAVFFDFDRDGLLDLYLINVGQYTSEELRTAHHGDVRYRFHDGFGDAFGGHHYPERTEPSLLFRNVGNGRFEDVTEIIEGAEPGWSGDAAAIDVNADGWPDLYELNMQGHDQYYENREGKSFVRRSRDLFPKTSWGAMGIKAFDWNNDGHLDIYITDMHSDMSKEVGPDNEHVRSDMQWSEEHLQSGGLSIFGNTFFENKGNGRFAEISDRIGAENYWPWGLSVGDLNADGWQDVFVTLSMNYPFRYQTNTVLINDRGETLRRAEFILGVEPRRNRQTAQPWFDLDCSDPADRRHPLCANTDRPVQAWGAVGSRSAVIFDLDGDGDLDIVTNEFNSVPQILMSNFAQVDRDLRWVGIKLRGRASNRDGLGARVTVTAGEASYMQVLDGKSGYLSQSSLPLYFGLGGASPIDSICIDWPSGATQSVTGTATNTLLEITEPAPQPSTR